MLNLPVNLSSKRVSVLAASVITGVLLAGLAACQTQEPVNGQRAAAAVDTAAIMAAFDSMRSAYEEAYAAGDYERISSIVHPEMAYSPPGRPPIQGHDSIMAYERRMRPPGATLDIEPMDVRIMSSEWVYELGTVTVTFTPEGSDEPQSMESTYLTVFRKTPDGWKAYRESLSANQPPAGGP